MRKNKKKSYSEFFRLRCEAGYVDPHRAADLCGVTLRTIRNWDTQGAPLTAMRLFQLLTQDLGGFHEEWRGWRFHGPDLYGPGKLRLTVEQLRGFKRSLHLLELLESENRKLRQHWAIRLEFAWHSFQRELFRKVRS